MSILVLWKEAREIGTMKWNHGQSWGDPTPPNPLVDCHTILPHDCLVIHLNLIKGSFEPLLSCIKNHPCLCPINARISPNNNPFPSFFSHNDMVFINESINEDMINGIFHNHSIKGKKKNGDNFFIQISVHELSLLKCQEGKIPIKTYMKFSSVFGSNIMEQNLPSTKSWTFQKVRHLSFSILER